jgi:hypothetical protein
MITSGWKALALLRSLLDLMHSSVSTPSARNTNRDSLDNLGGMEAKLKETKLKLENSGEIRHTLVLWNQIISGIFRVQAWETKIK